MKNHIYLGLILSLLVLLIIFHGHHASFSQEDVVYTVIFYVK